MFFPRCAANELYLRLFFVCFCLLSFIYITHHQSLFLTSTMSLLFILAFLGWVEIVKGVSLGDSVHSIANYPFYVMMAEPVQCGGVLISLDPAWVLTAGHCIRTAAAENISIGYCSTDLQFQRRVRVDMAVTHPWYLGLEKRPQPAMVNDDDDKMRYDLGLIRLQDPVPDAQRIALAPTDTLPTSATVVGMGYTGLGQSQANRLQKAKCSIISSVTATDLGTPDGTSTDDSSIEDTSDMAVVPVEELESLQDNMVLTTSNARLCHGDSGM